MPEITIGPFTLDTASGRMLRDGAEIRLRPQALQAQRLQHAALQLRGLVRSLHAISPLATVARGYSILQHEDGRIVRSTDDAAIGERLDARLHDGRLLLRVEGRQDTER